MEALNETTVKEYLVKRGLAGRLGGGPEDWVAEPITDGNVNLLFRVKNPETGRSLIVKQALGYAWRYPDFKMPTERLEVEHAVLQVAAEHAPEQVPEVYFFSPEDAVLVMEDLNRHREMRAALSRLERFPRAAEHLGRYMARTLFYTSDLYLPSGEKKRWAAELVNPVLRKVQEDLVFTQPFVRHPNNRYSKPLEPLVREIYADDALRAEVLELKERYMTQAQALIHNDLHTGSILANEEETKVVDPEFAFFGPMGHDLGTYLGNLALAYAAAEAHAPNEEEKRAFREWLLESMAETWRVFEREFLAAWEKDAQHAAWPSDRYRERYLKRLLQDTAGFGAAEMYRRLIGMAHVSDFWSIEDELERARAESLALAAARSWLMDRHGFDSITDLTERLAAARVSPLLQ
ncbi:S-methyl-5-thioribose kinase [Oceanithermus sp.]